MVQLVVIPDHEAAYTASKECRNECVIEVTGGETSAVVGSAEYVGALKGG